MTLLMLLYGKAFRFPAEKKTINIIHLGFTCKILCKTIWWIAILTQDETHNCQLSSASFFSIRSVHSAANKGRHFVENEQAWNVQDGSNKKCMQSDSIHIIHLDLVFIHLYKDEKVTYCDWAVKPQKKFCLTPFNGPMIQMRCCHTQGWLYLRPCRYMADLSHYARLFL